MVRFASKDVETAERVVEALAAQGFDVTGLGGADDAPDLSADDMLVVLWSRNALQAPWLQREARAALAAGRLAMVRVDGASAPPSLRTPNAVTLAAHGLWAERRITTLNLEPTLLTPAEIAPEAPAAAAAAPARAAFGLGQNPRVEAARQEAAAADPEGPVWRERRWLSLTGAVVIAILFGLLGLAAVML